MATKKVKGESIQEQETKTRIRRSDDERRREIDDKIAYHQQIINNLNEKRAKIGQTRTRTTKMGYNRMVATLKESGISPEQVIAFIENLNK